MYIRYWPIYNVSGYLALLLFTYLILANLQGEPEKAWKKSFTVLLIVLAIIATVIALGLIHWKIANWHPEIEGLGGTDQDTMISQASTLTVPRQGYRLSGSWTGFTLSRTG